jgi:hypothetical protein
MAMELEARVIREARQLPQVALVPLGSSAARRQWRPLPRDYRQAVRVLWLPCVPPSYESRASLPPPVAVAVTERQRKKYPPGVITTLWRVGYERRPSRKPIRPLKQNCGRNTPNISREMRRNEVFLEIL